MYISNTHKEWKTRVRERGCLFMHSSFCSRVLEDVGKKCCTTVDVLNRAYTLRETLTHFWYYTYCYVVPLLKPLELVWEG